MFPLIFQLVGSAMQNQALPGYAPPPQDNTAIILGSIVGIAAVGALIYFAVKH